MLIETPIGMIPSRDGADVERLMRRRLGIPERFCDAPALDSGELRVLKRIKAYMKSGCGAFLYGIPGCGKTTVATEAFYEQALTLGGGLWVSHLMLLDAVRHNLDGDDLERAVEAPIIMLDDFGALKPTEWAQERTFALVSLRYNAKALTIVTSNFQPDVLKDIWGAPVISRLREMCPPIAMPRVDYRQRAISKLESQNAKLD